MAERVTVSIPENRTEYLEWVDEKVEEGEFSSRSHAFWYGIKKLKDDGVSDVVV